MDQVNPCSAEREIGSVQLSNNAWYETNFYLTNDSEATVLYINTQEANAFIAYVDGQYVSNGDTHNHLERNITLCLNLGRLAMGTHSLSLLSESLGYSNLIGRWGTSTSAKNKGITGEVMLQMYDQEKNITLSLTDGRIWRSFPGLHGERCRSCPRVRKNDCDALIARARSDTPQMAVPSWSSALFQTPPYDPKEKALFFDITSGRGHLWLNGNDLGRYWNITRGMTIEFSQRYYFLPNDYLRSNNDLNELVLFDAFGGDHRNTRLLLSWIESSDTANFEDEVGFLLSCI